jgi:hypothetical protein
MLIGGAAMTLIGIAVLSVEGLRANATLEQPRQEMTSTRLMRAVALTGGLMVGLSTFQAEFDFGVPQFQLVFQPLLLMLAAGFGLVLARIYAGRGAALGAVLFFVVVRGGLALMVGPVLGQTTPHFPLYIVEALVVEAIALRISTDEPLRFGLWAGVGIGTFGLAAEWAWSHLWMPLAWPAALFPEGAIVGFLAALAGAMLGAWAGTRLSLDPGVRRPRLRGAAVAAAATLVGLVAFGLYTSTDQGLSARVALRDVPSGDGRQAIATVRLSPPDAAENAEWFNVTAWQGGGLVVDPLRRLGPGLYRTTKPIPLHGDWKTLLRLHEGNSLAAVPIYLPRDAAIPVGEVPAPNHFQRSFGNEHQLLQREQKGGSPVLVAVAYSCVVAISFGLLALLAWALHRLAFGKSPRQRRRQSQAPRRGPLGLEGGGGR